MPNDDRDRPPAGRAPLVPRQPARDFAPPKTSPHGVPIGATKPQREDITGVHKDPIAEMQARIRVMQHNTASFDTRLKVVEETQVKQGEQLDGQDRKLDKLQTGVETTNRLVGSVVDLARSKVTLEHDVTRAQFELGTAREVDKIDETKQQRERKTAGISARWKIAYVVIAALCSAAGYAFHALAAGGGH